MDREALLERARGKGVNPFVHWVTGAILQPVRGRIRPKRWAVAVTPTTRERRTRAA